MNIREAIDEDIDNGLFTLFVEGFNLHHDNRSDIFPDLDDEEKKCDFDKMFNDENKKIIVVEDDNKVVGYIEFQIKDKKTKSLWIDELFVDDVVDLIEEMPTELKDRYYFRDVSRNQLQHIQRYRAGNGLEEQDRCFAG